MKKLYNFTSIFVFGAISTFAIPPFSIVISIFFLGLAMYKISQLDSLKETFFAGWLLGFGWFLVGLYWIGNAFFVADTYHIYFMPIAVILLPSILAIFWGVSFFLAKLFTRKKNSSLVLIIVFLSLFEYFRAFAFTGFPWLMPSMVLSTNNYLIQIFSFIGTFAGNLIVVTISILPFFFFFNFKNKVVLLSIFFIPIIFLFSISFLRFHHKEIGETKGQLVTIVQPNIDQKEKWDIEKREKHINRLIELSNKKNMEETNLNRIIIWPETSFAGFIPNEKLLLSSIAKKTIKSENTKLVVGLLRFENNKIFNSLVFLDSKGKTIYNYDKLHLVPFGEYIPLRETFKKISDYISKNEFSSGVLKPNITLDGFGEILTLICYEVLFSSEVNARISKNTNFMINITNDAWFGKTPGPHQHFALAKIRAVELGLPLIRVANTGISGVISPYGDEIIKIGLHEEGSKTVNLISGLYSTKYKKFGDSIFFILIFILIPIHILIPISKKRI